MTLSPLETIALSKAIKDTAVRDARPKLAEGHHDVDVTIRLHGPLLVAPPSPTKIKESVAPEILLALVLQLLNRPAKAMARDYVADELEAWANGQEPPEVQPDALATAESLLALARRERAGTKNGNVTAPLTIDLISRAA
jgi:hypothetical protein